MIRDSLVFVVGLFVSMLSAGWSVWLVVSALMGLFWRDMGEAAGIRIVLVTVVVAGLGLAMMNYAIDDKTQR
jgi:hypothetical protein